MTDTHNLSALAMRTRAVAKLEERSEHYAKKKQKHSILEECNVTDHERYAECEMATNYAIGDILALPLEADPAALVAEALRLPEVRALVETMAGLKRIVEEIDGAMNHGTWRDEKGMRLKDTPEWVSAYAALAVIKELKI